MAHNDVFAADGQYLGEVRVGARLGRFATQGDRMAAVTTDGNGVERVYVWRIQPPG